VARWLARHPEVSAFEGTGVWQDEGQHLQDVFAPASAHGGPGAFAFDNGARLTERSALVSPSSRERLWSAWSGHWDLTKPVLLEKSPPNLIRMRFLEALFPGRARFLVVVRHPVAVALATRKWTRRFARTPPRLTRRVPPLQVGLDSLLSHWVLAHERFLDDAAQVDRVMVVRYEDVVGDPTRELARAFRFAGLTPLETEWDVRADLNDRYVARWERARRTIGRRRHLDALARRYEDRVRPFGYSLLAPERLFDPAGVVAEYVAAGP
jgi:hypothetical protein